MKKVLSSIIAVLIILTPMQARAGQIKDCDKALLAAGNYIKQLEDLSAIQRQALDTASSELNDAIKQLNDARDNEITWTERALWAALGLSAGVILTHQITKN